jgi:hypothetical protein
MPKLLVCVQLAICNVQKWRVGDQGGGAVSDAAATRLDPLRGGIAPGAHTITASEAESSAPRNPGLFSSVFPPGGGPA